MNEQVFYNNDVAVVAHSAVLPMASSSRRFWENCLNEKNSFSNISDERFKKYLISEKKEISQDRIYSTLAAEISGDDYRQYLRNSDLSGENANRLSAYTFEAMAQLVPQLKTGVSNIRTDLILGCMNPDSDHEMQIILETKSQYRKDLLEGLDLSSKDIAEVDRQLDELVSHLSSDMNSNPQSFFVSAILAKVCAKFGLRGEQFLIDAACASSLAAIEISIQRLKLGLTDLVISGGIESNLGHGAYMVFSKVGALAEVHSLPFDQRTQGLVQGEGAVLFALKRLSDAVRDGDTVHAVVRGVAGSSDGRSASLFQPDAAGQRAVYEKVYGKDNRLDYLEAHGTGTPVGDQTEMESIRHFFKGQRLPVGSVKSLIGHTKGAAGGAGVLKAIHVIQEGVVPGSSYVRESIFTDDGRSPFLNVEKIELSGANPRRAGINAFGFGGTNYHLLVEQFLRSASLRESRPLPNQKVGIVASSEVELSGFAREDFLKVDFPTRLPPNSISAVDKTQLLALLTTWNCVKYLGPLFACIPRDKINVVSACSLCLDQVFELVHRCFYEMVISELEKKPEKTELATKINNRIENHLKPRYAPINEDAATGILNNVIAGRVANLFDLSGKTYNLDKNIASGALGLATVYNELQVNPDQVFIFIEVIETLAPDQRRTERCSVLTRIVTSERYAAQQELHIQKFFTVKTSEAQNANAR